MTKAGAYSNAGLFSMPMMGKRKAMTALEGMDKKSFASRLLRGSLTLARFVAGHKRAVGWKTKRRSKKGTKKAAAAPKEPKAKKARKAKARKVLGPAPEGVQDIDTTLANVLERHMSK